MMATEESLRVMKYDRENTVRVFVKLNKNTDGDIIQRLDEVDNKQGYIKGLIRKDIKAYGETKERDTKQDDG